MSKFEEMYIKGGPLRQTVFKIKSNILLIVLSLKQARHRAGAENTHLLKQSTLAISARVLVCFMDIISQCIMGIYACLHSVTTRENRKTDMNAVC